MSKLPEKCNACGQPLALANLYVDDGCPCNSRRGVNVTPSKCGACKSDNCVKPGHQLVALFGNIPASSTAVALSDYAAGCILLGAALKDSRGE